MERREFLKTAPLAAYGFTRTAAGIAPTKLRDFDYQDVRLLPGRWESQVRRGRDFYFGVGDDDILHGFRAASGRKAPGKPLGGWCGVDSSTVFGQWLSGMSRLSRATGDAALRDKAVGLFEGWVETLPPDGDARMGHYRFDKLVGGLVDLDLYAGHRKASAVLSRVTANAVRTLERPENPREALADPTHNQRYYGVPQEWYTLAENLHRAYRLTGDPMFRAFAEEWHYHAYWAKFRKTSSPPDAHGVHAYSHVNTFSSAAAAYEATGEPAYLDSIRNAFDYLQRHQCFATGGYGPNERFMALDGSLGRALETRSDTFEASCGSWAGFKLARYLLRLTGEARYGDWIERLLYNGVGAALPITEGGRSFYYGDYRVGGGMKVYNWDTYTCCSGTYIQNLAEYHNLIYFKDDAGLYVNLFLPSSVRWSGLTITQETRYPDSDTTTLSVKAEASEDVPSPLPRAFLDQERRGARERERRSGGRSARFLGDRTANLVVGRPGRDSHPPQAAHGARRRAASEPRGRDARSGGIRPRGCVPRSRLCSPDARRRARALAGARRGEPSARRLVDRAHGGRVPDEPPRLSSRRALGPSPLPPLLRDRRELSLLHVLRPRRAPLAPVVITPGEERMP